MLTIFLLGFTERPFFDRGGGFDDRSGQRNPRMENRRDESNNRPPWNATANKDDERMPVNSSEENDPKDKKASRWGNSSPKSIVSEEENWDDENERKNDGKSPVVPLPQTEPIDDDSDVDFDDGATSTMNEKTVKNENNDTGGDNENVGNDEPQQSVPLQQPVVNSEQNQPNKSFDIFNDDETATNRPQATAVKKCDDKVNANADKNNVSAECNTTPLYDEPEEKKENAKKDEHHEHDIGIESESKDEKNWEPEPGVPGIDE